MKLITYYTPSHEPLAKRLLGTNRLLRRCGLRYRRLSGLFASPRTVIGRHWNGEKLHIPAATICFHANWTIGVENKLKLLDMVLAHKPREDAPIINAQRARTSNAFA